jgi:CheY-like chemotaxis protein
MLGSDLQHDDLIDMIERAALRGRDLCSQLLSFARADKPTLEPLATLETVEEVIKISERTFPREVRLSVDAADRLPRMSGSRSQITQALMNLLVNARDAMPEGGRLTVRAHESHGIPADELHYAEHAGTTFVRLDVEDEGTGMSPEVLRRAYEPFFTTKSAAKGTGLGLPMAFSIAKGHGGAIRLWSTLGTGTKVSLFIPAAPAGSAVEPEGPVDDERLESFAGTETVLIVDDEAMVRTVGARVLRQFGYRTFEASSGPEALRLLAEENIDVVLLDIVMPEMEGPEVYRRMREAGIDVPVLLCSGFSVAGLVDKLTKEGAAGFVQKPYRLQEILPRLRETLDRRGALGQELTANS